MKTRLLMTVVALGVLAGCASSDDLRRKDPVFFTTTQKTAVEYATCVVQSWRGLGETVNQREIPNGFDIAADGRLGNIDSVIRVQTYDNKTHVNMYSRMPYGHQDMMQSANLCI
ncbi:hypothetical protein RBI13_16350 [Alcaligenaceae bacterium A4P071]|nr:hypothetical protein [Alcaligenaceae bacterium A4P071]